MEDADAVSEHDWEHQEVWVTRGDIFVPPCCVPCCCLSGRQHVYSDENLSDCIEAFYDGERHPKLDKNAREDLETNLNMHEGVTFEEVVDMTKDMKRRFR